VEGRIVRRLKQGQQIIFDQGISSLHHSQDIEAITKPDVAHHTKLQPHLGFMPKASHKLNYSVSIIGRGELFRINPKLSPEVLIRVATLLEFCPPQHHMANNDFLRNVKVLNLG
jgi:hypothetical protein